MSSNARPQFVDLVCEGGGVKGIGLAGAYSVLEERGFVPKNVAGTSAGAITAAAIAAGYTAAELKELILTIDYHKFMDKGVEDRLPFLEKTISILRDQGIYEGDYFLEFMRDLLKEKGVKTFADLRARPPDDGIPNEFDHTLQVIVSDVTEHRLLVLPRDSDALGVPQDELEVALAVRMSMSIPIFFEPVRHKNPENENEHVLVDGGMLSNFPVWLFDCRDREPRWPTFGMLLVEPNPKQHTIGDQLPPRKAKDGPLGIVPFLRSLADTMMAAHDRLYVESADWARTIPIKTLGVGTTDFELPKERALQLYESGRTAATEFLARWSFEGYIEEFRKGRAVPGRTEEIAERMNRAAPA